MKKPDPTEESLSELRAMRESGVITGLAPYLRNKSSAVVARAAEMSAYPDLTQDLVTAFRRIFPNAPKRDPGCRALTNIAKALVRLDASAAEVYAAGIHYRQLEASYGPPVDTAAELRAVSAMGFVAMGDPNALLACCDLLSDEVADARIGAIRALAISGRPDAELLLRFKARLGDEKPEAVAETFVALLALGPKARSVPYISEFLDADEETAESAALALGESRFTEAVEPLRSAYQKRRNPSLLLAMALTRDEAAVAFCLSQLDEGEAAALDALAIFKSNTQLKQQVRDKLNDLQDRRMEEIWRTKWF